MDIEKIISEMTLEEKAAFCFGGDFWHTKAIERLGIPAVMMCDGPHGLRKQKDETDHLGINESIEAVCFPTASALAASFDRQLLADLGSALGDECQAENVGMLLGPGLNIKRSPLCGRNFEYFSEDPYLTGELGTAYIKALQDKGVAACPKHFAANNQETRRMSGDSVVDERSLHEIYLPAFEQVVKEGKTQSLMCSYNRLNGTYLSENKELLTDILRERWGFNGFVVTDWGAGKGQVSGVLAGLDLVMPGSPEAVGDKIVKAVNDGELDIAVLDNTVKNILNFVKSYQDGRIGGEFIISQHRQKAADFETECAVLLKNEGGALPLSENKKYAFIGEFAQKPRYQGAGSSHINVPHATGVMECVDGLNISYCQGYAVKGGDSGLLEEAVAAAKSADAAVLFVGLPDAYETEGVDRDDMKMPENQNKLIEAVAAAQPNTIVVLHGGAPVEMPWAGRVPAILNMYLGGDSVGVATKALLFGEANPSGKLAESYPHKLEDNPSFLNFPGTDGVVEYKEGIYVGYRYYDKKKMDVLFPFGHGLSYTSFEYSDIKADKAKLSPGGKLVVSCKVKNTGAAIGKEVVQLYVRDVQSSAGRPVRELRGFEKVSLHPGEEKTIHFVLDDRSFAYYEPQIHDWHIENGEFMIEIGASSRDIRLSLAVEMENAPELPIHYHRNSTIGDLLKSEKGKAIAANMMQGSEQVVSGGDQLGEGSDKMVRAMMLEMPLSSIVGFGRMSEEQLEGMLAMLNS